LSRAISTFHVEKIAAIRPSNATVIASTAALRPSISKVRPVSERAQMALRSVRPANQDASLDIDRIVEAVESLDKLAPEKRERLVAILEQGERLAKQIAATNDASGRDEMFRRWQFQLSLRLEHVLDDPDQLAIAEALAIETAKGMRT
jgi:hypothetical protein